MKELTIFYFFPLNTSSSDVLCVSPSQQLLDTIKHLEKENRTLRDFSLSNYVGTTQSSAEVESDSTRKDREKHMKELKLLKRTIEEMELRIETQKQTLGTRDESIRKLMDMLQSKGLF